MTITLLLLTLFLLPSFTTAGRLRETREDEKNAPCDQTTKSTIRQIDGGIWQTCDGNGVWKNRFCRSCEMKDRTINCVGLPIHAERNTATSVTQSWDRNKLTRLPSIFGKYNTTVSTSECRFKCASGYHRSNNRCVSSTRQADCIGLPDNAQRNTATGITQNWNGTDWLPSATGSYNVTASTSECRYKCATNFTRSDSSCIVSSSRYPGCDTDDIKIGNYTIAACNVGASVAGITSASYGSYLTFAQAQTACSAGYHLAKDTDWQGVLSALGYTTSQGTAWQTALKLPRAGGNPGETQYIGARGYYWTTNASNASMRMDTWSNTIKPGISDSRTSYGLSVRCFKN